MQNVKEKVYWQVFDKVRVHIRENVKEKASSTVYRNSCHIIGMSVYWQVSTPIGSEIRKQDNQ